MTKCKTKLIFRKRWRLRSREKPQPGIWALILKIFDIDLSYLFCLHVNIFIICLHLQGNMLRDRGWSARRWPARQYHIENNPHRHHHHHYWYHQPHHHQSPHEAIIITTYYHWHHDNHHNHQPGEWQSSRRGACSQRETPGRNHFKGNLERSRIKVNIIIKRIPTGNWLLSSHQKKKQIGNSIWENSAALALPGSNLKCKI